MFCSDSVVIQILYVSRRNNISVGYMMQDSMSNITTKSEINHCGAETSFQSHVRSCNHFLAGEIQPVMSCIGAIKIFQQVSTGLVLI